MWSGASSRGDDLRAADRQARRLHQRGAAAGAEFLLHLESSVLCASTIFHICSFSTRILRIVDTVRMRDLTLGDEDCPQSGG